MGINKKRSPSRKGAHSWPLKRKEAHIEKEPINSGALKIKEAHLKKEPIHGP